MPPAIALLASAAVSVHVTYCHGQSISTSTRYETHAREAQSVIHLQVAPIRLHHKTTVLSSTSPAIAYLHATRHTQGRRAVTCQQDKSNRAPKIRDDPGNPNDTYRNLSNIILGRHEHLLGGLIWTALGGWTGWR